MMLLEVVAKTLLMFQSTLYDTSIPYSKEFVSPNKWACVHVLSRHWLFDIVVSVDNFKEADKYIRHKSILNAKSNNAAEWSLRPPENWHNINPTIFLVVRGLT